MNTWFITLFQNWNNHIPMLGVLVFLPKNFLDFWHFLPRSWQIFLASFARFCKIFQDRGKKSKKIFGLLGKKTKTIQDLGKRTMKTLHQSNASKKYLISQQLSLKTQKRGYSCVCFYLNLNLAWPKRMKHKYIEIKWRPKLNIFERKQWSKLTASNCVVLSIFIGYTIESTLRWKKSGPMFLHRVPETQIQQKLPSPNSSFPKLLLTF